MCPLQFQDILLHPSSTCFLTGHKYRLYTLSYQDRTEGMSLQWGISHGFLFSSWKLHATGLWLHVGRFLFPVCVEGGVFLSTVSPGSLSVLARGETGLASSIGSLAALEMSSDEWDWKDVLVKRLESMPFKLSKRVRCGWASMSML